MASCLEAQDENSNSQVSQVHDRRERRNPTPKCGLRCAYSPYVSSTGTVRCSRFGGSACRACSASTVWRRQPQADARWCCSSGSTSTASYQYGFRGFYFARVGIDLTADAIPINVNSPSMPLRGLMRHAAQVSYIIKLPQLMASHRQTACSIQVAEITAGLLAPFRRMYRVMRGENHHTLL